MTPSFNWIEFNTSSRYQRKKLFGIEPVIEQQAIYNVNLFTFKKKITLGFRDSALRDFDKATIRRAVY